MRSRGRTSHVLSGMFNLQHCLTHCCSDCSNNISFFQVNKLAPEIKKKVKEKILHKEVHVRRLLCRINCSSVTVLTLFYKVILAPCGQDLPGTEGNIKMPTDTPTVYAKTNYKNQ